MISSKEIVELFSYSKEEQDTFPYLHRYMKRVSKKLLEIQSDKESLKKFALAGLFLTYRAANHSGCEMTTGITDFSPNDIHYKRLRAYKEYFGGEIKDSSHYLTLINLSSSSFLVMTLGLYISRKLYFFVVK